MLPFININYADAQLLRQVNSSVWNQQTKEFKLGWTSVLFARKL